MLTRPPPSFLLGNRCVCVFPCSIYENYLKDEGTINTQAFCYCIFQNTEFISGDKAPGFLSSNAEGAKPTPETESHYKQAQDEAQEDESV